MLGIDGSEHSLKAAEYALGVAGLMCYHLRAEGLTCLSSELTQIL